MNLKDIEWLEKCKANPTRYPITVDNDDISVYDNETEGVVHSFSEYGYEFALVLLKHIGCNAEPA